MANLCITSPNGTGHVIKLVTIDQNSGALTTPGWCFLPTGMIMQWNSLAVGAGISVVPNAWVLGGMTCRIMATASQHFRANFGWGGTLSTEVQIDTSELPAGTLTRVDIIGLFF